MLNDLLTGFGHVIFKLFYFIYYWSLNPKFLKRFNRVIFKQIYFTYYWSCKSSYRGSNPDKRKGKKIMGMDRSDVFVNSKLDDLIRSWTGFCFTASIPKNGRLISINDGQYRKLVTNKSKNQGLIKNYNYPNRPQKKKKKKNQLTSVHDFSGSH